MEDIHRAEVEQHLLFHKALAEDTESFDRINGYMRILNSNTGERLSDPVDESIRSVFNLVIDNGIDPWEIDLGEFVKMYSRKVSENSFDMMVAGRLLLMAWRVLRLQSEVTYGKGHEPEVDEDAFMESDFDFEDEDVQMAVPEVAFKKAFQRETMRPVTMYELIDAFEDARADLAVQQERERVRSELRAKEPRKFDNKAHDEDDEKDVEHIWDMIDGLNIQAVKMSDLYTGVLKDDLRVFIAVLHLVRDGRIDVRQEVLPYGDVFLDVCCREIAVGE